MSSVRHRAVAGEWLDWPEASPQVGLDDGVMLVRNGVGRLSPSHLT